MPDDIIEEVTEQVPEEPVVTEEETGEQDAMDAFGDEEAEKKPEEKPAEEAEEPSEEVVEEAVEEEEEPAEEELDEDETRGKELLEAEEKAAEDAKAKEVAPETSSAPAKVPYTPDDIKLFSQFGDISLFPEGTVDVNGVTLDIRQHLEDFPEARAVSGIVAKGIVDRMIENKVLVTSEAITDLKQELANERYRDKVDSILGSDSAKIWNDKKFQEYKEKAPKEVQALFRSPEPGDAARGFKRFLNASGMEKAGKKVAELDSKRAEAKKKADAIYKTTVRAKKTATASKAGETGIEDALDEFNRDD